MSTPTSLELAQAIARAAEDSKAENIVIYDLRDISSLTDYVVVCNGLSITHLRAVIRDVESKVEEEVGVSPVYSEHKAASLWTVLDYINVMFHVLTPETRENYQLDKLWSKGHIVAPQA